MKIWLDLEDTIITNWHDRILLNPTKIKEFLDQVQVDQLNIWSFAIWNEDDVDMFERHIKVMLEDVLGYKISQYISVKDMMDTIKDNIWYENISDFVSINGKPFSFIKHCIAYHKGSNCVLIDDVVPNWHLHDKSTDTNIELININSLTIPSFL